MSNPAKVSRCPSERTWDEVATGLVVGPVADELLAHASTCASCAETLRQALEVFAPSESSENRIATTPANRPSRLKYWLSVAAAVIVICGGVLWWRQRRVEDALTLLAQAYSENRRFELRIPGAAYGAVNLERTGETRALSSESPEILDLAARIARQTREHPTDPYALHARGRLALIEWKPADAIGALQGARDLGAPQPDVAIDLATAYYQRGELRGTEGAADLSLALDLLGRILQQHPKNTVARFNRSIVAERLHLLAPAVQDLEEVMRSEPSPEWRKEAEERLKRLRQALRGLFERLPDADRKRFAEVALDYELAAGLTAQAPIVAERLLREHGDQWLSEIQEHRNAANSALIAQLSTLASIRATSARGRYSVERDLLRGWESVRLPPPLQAWLDYEVAYRSTHSGSLFPCNPVTRSQEFLRRHYFWIAANLEREAAICLSLQGALAETIKRSRKAVAIAREARLPVTHVRNESIDAAFDYRQGRYRETLNRFTELLGRIGKEQLPVVRSHEPLHNMVVATAALGRHHASQVIAAMATGVADATGLQSAQFADRINGADAAFRAKDSAAAAELYREALNLHDRVPALLTTPDARPWAEMILAGLVGGKSLPEQLATSRDPFVRLPFIRRKAKADELAGRTSDARARLEQSLHWLVESRGGSRHQVWRQEQRATADELLRLAVSHNTPWESMEHLQKLLELDQGTLRTGPVRRSPWRADLVFALRSIGDDVLVWRATEGAVELRQNVGLVPKIEASVRRLRYLVSSPAGGIEEIRFQAEQISEQLFGKWIRGVGPGKKILFQGEGWLAEIPFPLLTTSQGELGLHHEWALTLGAISDAPATPLLNRSGDRILVDATRVTSLASWNLPPLPFPHAEQTALRTMPGRSSTLEGNSASAPSVRRALRSADLFHFAGHAVEQNGTIRLLLSDGTFSIEGTPVPPVVVLSACLTGRAYQEEVDTLSAGTLANAFVLAGAAEAVASSWNLDTSAASRFAPVFYSRLDGGVGTAMLEAVRHVAVSLAHPYYWAGQLRLIQI